ncbi:MAG: thioredoxin family protein [Alistipes sp.]|jgi:thioredoxin 1|nr:thioredoxin family protein [Alistipes sp.]
MTTRDFDNIIASHRLTLINFHAAWCGACRAIEPALERLSLAMGDSLAIVRVDIDNVSTREIVRRYNIVSVPTLLLFSQGRLLWRESGVVSFEKLRLSIRRYQFIAL